MFLITLTFAKDRQAAADHMGAHNQWVAKGFDDGAFLLVGSLAGGAGGAILATAQSRAEIEDRVSADPFVAHKIVAPSIIEFTPGKADPRLEFLLG